MSARIADALRRAMLTAFFVVALSMSYLLDEPTELEAAQDVADDVGAKAVEAEAQGR